MADRMKAYHDKWGGDDLAKARADGIVIDNGEAWRYEYTHKDELGTYDLWYRTRDPLNPEIMQSDMTLRDYFAGQALCNSSICTGAATGAQLKKWFGNRHVVDREEIVSKQALAYADAMLEARKK